MNIKIDIGKVLSASSALVDTSRILRHSRVEIEEVCSQMKDQTELNRCRYELRKQAEATALITAKLVALSISLSDVANVYENVDAQNADALEGTTVQYQRNGQVKTKKLGRTISNRINRILYH